MAWARDEAKLRWSLGIAVLRSIAHMNFPSKNINIKRGILQQKLIMSFCVKGLIFMVII